MIPTRPWLDVPRNTAANPDAPGTAVRSALDRSIEREPSVHEVHLERLEGGGTEPMRTLAEGAFDEIPRSRIPSSCEMVDDTPVAEEGDDDRALRRRRCRLDVRQDCGESVSVRDAGDSTVV